MAGLTVKIKGDASDFERTMAGVDNRISGIGKSLAVGTAQAAAFGAAILAAGASFATWKVIDFIKDASGAAANMETLTAQFETLLGSADKAKARMAEITEFAAKTPFGVGELAKASKLLQTLSGDTLAIGKGLTMVGDAAALAGEPLGEVALHIGRVFSAITTGNSAGESVSRLQELGMISGESKLNFERLAEAQKKGEAATLSSEKAFKLLAGTMASSEGAMKRISATTEGKLSNLQDNIDSLKVSFGTGFNLNLRPVLDNANAFLPAFTKKFEDAGKLTGVAFTDALTGNFDLVSSAGEVLGKQMLAGVGTAFDQGLQEIFIQAWSKYGDGPKSDTWNPLQNFLNDSATAYARKRRDELKAARPSPDATFNEYGSALGLPDAQQRLKDQRIAALSNKMDPDTQSLEQNRLVKERWERNHAMRDHLIEASRSMSIEAKGGASSNAPVALDEKSINALKGVLREASIPKFTR